MCEENPCDSCKKIKKHLYISPCYNLYAALWIFYSASGGTNNELKNGNE